MFQSFRKYGVAILAQMLVLMPISAFAQTSPVVPAPAQQSNSSAFTQSIAGFLDGRLACMDNYNFNSVTVSVDTKQSMLDHQYLPGETMVVSGIIHNPNNYPLVGGRMYAHVLREDASMAEKNWHPYLSQEFISGTYDVAANQSIPFQYQWRIPAKSLTGTYRIELYYLVGNRYVMSGIPYVANFTGASAPFTVIRPVVTSKTTSSEISGFNFDRNSVTINDQAIHLREIPPQFEPGKPITIKAMLSGLGRGKVEGTVHMDLYAWSITDGTKPILSKVIPVSLGTTDTPITFTWDAPTAGTYEAVFTANNNDPEAVPSVLDVRFPVTGLVPRIVYSGIGAIADGKATINACVVNATFGSGEGSMTNSLIVGGKELQTKDGKVLADQLSTALITSSIADLTGKQFDVHVVAKNAAGAVADETTVSYPATTFGAQKNSVTPAPVVQTNNPSSPMGKYVAAGVVITLILIVIGTVMMRSRRKQYPKFS